MTQEHKDRLAQYKVYLEQQLADLKDQLKTETDALLLGYHIENVEKAQRNIIQESEQRLRDIAERKKNYSSSRVLPREIKMLNNLFNTQVRITESLANAHYNRCIESGMKVEKVDFSHFIVAEDDGI